MRAEPVEVRADGAALAGDLRRPEDARGLVVFAHGSGSSRRSRRNVEVADALSAQGLATLLFDLLTPEEEARDRLDAALRFDIGLLADRLTGAVDWVAGEPAVRGLLRGLFGASTGAAAALATAARRPDGVAAVVSRGGRPDLAGNDLVRVRAPTLLLVGGRDETVLELNREAAGQLTAPHELVVVPGASHLFEEPGALGEVARRAGAWFARWLTPPGRAPRSEG